MRPAARTRKRRYVREERRHHVLLCRCRDGKNQHGGGASVTMIQAALAHAVTGGSLPRSLWIDHEAPPDWRTGKVCLRGPLWVEGVFRGGADGGGCAARTGGAMPCQRRHVKTIAWADFNAVRTRQPRRHIARDNCSYREQSGQPLPDAGWQAHRLPHTNARRKVRYTVERKEVFRNPLTPPAFDGVQGDARGQPIIARDNYFGIAR